MRDMLVSSKHPEAILEMLNYSGREGVTKRETLGISVH
jgi:hypothetical protein